MKNKLIDYETIYKLLLEYPINDIMITFENNKVLGGLYIMYLSIDKFNVWVLSKTQINFIVGKRLNKNLELLEQNLNNNIVKFIIKDME